MADTAGENIGFATAIGPTFFMLHGGDLRPDAAVAQAASLLAIPTPTAVYEPLAAPNTREDQTPNGSLKSFWAYADPAIAETRVAVSVRLA